jgi:hypothetical protein
MVNRELAFVLFRAVGVSGAPEGIRTPDQWIRNPPLYPAELRALCRSMAPGISHGPFRRTRARFRGGWRRLRCARLGRGPRGCEVAARTADFGSERQLRRPGQWALASTRYAGSRPCGGADRGWGGTSRSDSAGVELGKPASPRRAAPCSVGDRRSAKLHGHLFFVGSQTFARSVPPRSY